MIRIVMALALALTLAPRPAAPVTVRDLNGKTSTPLSPAPGATHVVFFVSADCPICNHYAPEIDRIAAEYAKRGVQSWLVYTDADVTPARVRSSLAEFHPHTAAPTVIDTGFALTTAADAKITPQAMIFTHNGLAYSGRIDDLYITAAQQRREPTSHDLRAALDAVLGGHAPSVASTSAIGCFIERKGK